MRTIVDIIFFVATRTTIIEDATKLSNIENVSKYKASVTSHDEAFLPNKYSCTSRGIGRMDAIFTNTRNNYGNSTIQPSFEIGVFVNTVFIASKVQGAGSDVITDHKEDETSKLMIHCTNIPSSRSSHPGCWIRCDHKT